MQCCLLVAVQAGVLSMSLLLLLVDGAFLPKGLDCCCADRHTVSVCTSGQPGGLVGDP